MTTLPALENQTPPQIDEQLAELWARTTTTRQRIAQASRPRQAFHGRPETPREQLDRETRLAGYQTKLAELLELTAPLTAEYDRRGGWERAFLVTNHGGHIHRTMSCPTCYPDTEFGWLTELSGSTEAQIIDAAGMTACTVCYPTAPVAQLTPEQRKAHTAAERDAKRAAKAELKRARELAKVPRAHALAVKVNELITVYGLEWAAYNAAYEATYPGNRYGSGYNTAFNVWHDIVRRRAARAA